MKKLIVIAMFAGLLSVVGVSLSPSSAQTCDPTHHDNPDSCTTSSYSPTYKCGSCDEARAKAKRAFKNGRYKKAYWLVRLSCKQGKYAEPNPTDDLALYYQESCWAARYEAKRFAKKGNYKKAYRYIKRNCR